jgi:hypothetical protein
MKETFEEWFSIAFSQRKQSWKLSRFSILRHCWDYQQFKIDNLEKEVNMYKASEKLLDAGISGSHLEVGKALAKQVIKLEKEIERLKGSIQNPSSNA